MTPSDLRLQIARDVALSATVDALQAPLAGCDSRPHFLPLVGGGEKADTVPAHEDPSPRVRTGAPALAEPGAPEVPVWLVPVWLPVRDGDPSGWALFRRHYTYRRSRDQMSLFWQRNRNYGLFVGPGEKVVLITPCGRALFAWRKFISMDNQEGVNCSVFRNEGAGLSSELIRAADDIAWARWPGTRLYTYVDPGKTRRKRDPGRCFLRAGWRYCGESKGGLRILECRPEWITLSRASEPAHEVPAGKHSIIARHIEAGGGSCIHPSVRQQEQLSREALGASGSHKPAMEGSTPSPATSSASRSGEGDGRKGGVQPEPPPSTIFRGSGTALADPRPADQSDPVGRDVRGTVTPECKEVGHELVAGTGALRSPTGAPTNSDAAAFVAALRSFAEAE